MKRLVEVIGTLILVGLVIKLFFDDVVRPYALFIAIAIVLVVVGGRAYSKARQRL